MKCELFVWRCSIVIGEDGTPKGCSGSFSAAGSKLHTAVTDYWKRFMYVKCGLFVWRCSLLPANTEHRRLSLVLPLLSRVRRDTAVADDGKRFTCIKCELFVLEIPLLPAETEPRGVLLVLDLLPRPRGESAVAYLWPDRKGRFIKDIPLESSSAGIDNLTVSFHISVILFVNGIANRMYF